MGIGNGTPTTQAERDRRINELHAEALTLWRRIEGIIDELKRLGPHSTDKDNALLNVREWLRMLARR
jgi:hypothetical protein